MKSVGFFLKGGSVFLVALFLCAVVSATIATAAEPPGVLKDVRVFSKGGQWHVVLVGSQSKKR